MRARQDKDIINGIVKVLREIEARNGEGENEFNNSTIRETRLLIQYGETFLVNSNPHVADRDKFERWAQDCAELTDFMKLN